MILYCLLYKAFSSFLRKEKTWSVFTSEIFWGKPSGSQHARSHVFRQSTRIILATTRPRDVAWRQPLQPPRSGYSLYGLERCHPKKTRNTHIWDLHLWIHSTFQKRYIYIYWIIIWIPLKTISNQTVSRVVVSPWLCFPSQKSYYKTPDTDFKLPGPSGTRPSHPCTPCGAASWFSRPKKRLKNSRTEEGEAMICSAISAAWTTCRGWGSLRKWDMILFSKSQNWLAKIPEWQLVLLHTKVDWFNWMNSMFLDLPY